MTKEEQNIADVRFICEEILRFLRMSPQEVIRHVKDDPETVFAHLNHPTYGILFCGPEAYDRFDDLAKRTIKPRSVESKSFHRPDYARALRDAFVEIFVDGGQDVSQRSVAKLVNRAKRLASEKLVCLTHHIPCTLFLECEPNKFLLGPVTFTHVDRFFEECKNAVKAESLADQNIHDIRKYYAAYGWVASVNVEPCHESISKARAERTVDAALDVLRILVPGYSQRYKRANQGNLPSKAFELATNQDGKMQTTVRFESKGAPAGDDWHAWLLSEGSAFWDMFGIAIGALASDEKVDHLHERLLDALNWFGQAVVENNPAAKVVKYTAALERLTMTGHVELGKIEKLIIERVAMLNHDRTDTTRETIRKEIGVLYQYRSDLMHGTRSPYDRSVSQVLRSAWEITRWSILNAAQLFTWIRKNGEPTRQTLAKVYDRWLEANPINDRE
jgi:hypothetical protein